MTIEEMKDAHQLDKRTKRLEVAKAKIDDVMKRRDISLQLKCELVRVVAEKALAMDAEEALQDELRAASDQDALI